MSVLYSTTRKQIVAKPPKAATASWSRSDRCNLSRSHPMGVRCDRRSEEVIGLVAGRLHGRKAACGGPPPDPFESGSRATLAGRN